MDDDSTKLIAHVARSTDLPRAQAVRLIEDILGFYNESAEAFVTRRHHELMAQGLKNPAIFEAIARELTQRRFRAPDLSARQLRRLIYG